MKTKGAKSAEKGVGEGRKKRKEREWGNCGWGGGHLCPLPPAAMFQRPARWCASHTPSCLSFFIPWGDSFQEWGSVESTCHLNFIPFNPPNDEGFSFLQQMTGVAWHPHAVPISLHLSPPLLGRILHITSVMGVVWYPHALPVLLFLPPLNNEGGF